MKNILFVMLLFIGGSIVAQNVGIGTTTPSQKLDVNGAIKIGTTGTNQPGAIRYNAGKFEGGDGNNWKSLEGTVSGIVGTELYNNPNLLNAGYSLFGEIPGIVGYNTFPGFLTGLQWWPTYTRGIVTNQPAPESGIAVWNGSLMYVASFNNLYSYDPTTDIWNIVSNQGFTSNQSQAIWTGTEIIFWNGDSGSGARYNPSTDTWVNLPLTNAPSTRAFYSMLWDGSRVIIWGGFSFSSSDLNSGAMYNPSTNTWTTMNISGAPTARLSHTAIWNNVGSRMIVWGGSNSSGGVFLNTGAIFNPVSNTWTGATNITGAPSIRDSHTAVWTGTEMLIFGGISSSQTLNTGGKYNPVTNSWTATSTAGVHSVSLHAAVWTGTAMFITGGTNSFGAITGLSYSYNPITNLWTNIGGFDEGKREHYSFYANNMIVVWGGLNSTLSYSNTGSRYFLTDIVSSVTFIYKKTLYLYQKN